MRCIACAAEMLLVKVVPEHTMMVPGYERYTLQCLGCYEVMDHLVFNRQRLLRLAEPAPSLSVWPALKLTGILMRVKPSSSAQWRWFERQRAPLAASFGLSMIVANPRMSLRTRKRVTSSYGTATEPACG